MKAKWLPLIEDGGVYPRDSGITLFLAKCLLLPAYAAHQERSVRCFNLQPLCCRAAVV